MTTREPNSKPKKPEKPLAQLEPWHKAALVFTMVVVALFASRTLHERGLESGVIELPEPFDFRTIEVGE